MKSRLLKLLAVAALAACAIVPVPARATPIGQVLCAPEPVVGTAGPRRVVNTSSTSSPQPSYTLNAAGCAYIANPDVGFFLSQGFTQGPNLFALQFVINSTSSTSSTSPTLPANAYIHNIIVNETGNQSFTGGIDIGTSAAGTQIVSALSVNSQTLVDVTDANLLKRLFVSSGTPTSQQIFFTCHTSCAGAVGNVSILYSLF